MRNRSFLLVAIVVGLGVCLHADARPENGFISVEPGVKLAYRKLGSGKQVIILPGDFLFRGAFDGLANDHTLITYDMRDRGRSSTIADPAKVSIQEDVNDLEA